MDVYGLHLISTPDLVGSEASQLRIISGTPSSLPHPSTICRRAWRRRLMSRVITTLCSADRPRICFASRVRSEISLCRMRWTACSSSCSGDFCGTNRIDGRPAAPQINSVILIRFNVRGNELLRDQPELVSEPGQHPRLINVNRCRLPCRPSKVAIEQKTARQHGVVVFSSSRSTRCCQRRGSETQSWPGPGRCSRYPWYVCSFTFWMPKCHCRRAEAGHTIEPVSANFLLNERSGFAGGCCLVSGDHIQLRLLVKEIPSCLGWRAGTRPAGALPSWAGNSLPPLAGIRFAACSY